MSKDDGRFKRKESGYRDTIKKEDAKKGRYHLYVSYACPWANRTLIMRSLKGLEDMIDISVVNYHMDGDWDFKEGPGVIQDPIFHAKDIKEIYEKAGRGDDEYLSVPILLDTETKKIVNNESSEIIRIFNEAFNEAGANDKDFYPEHLREEIDSWNERIYESVNNGVYKAGFAKTQEAYDEAVTEVFKVLDELEVHLEDKDYLVGDTLTEADIRLFVTLIRFDAAYVGHFKCNLKMIKDYKNLSRYTRNLYQKKEFKETIHFDHIKGHYYTSHPDINPTRIVPKGPDLSYLEE